MSSALERLANLVRQAESKTKAAKLGTETRQAADRLREAEERMRRAEKELHEIRPARMRELEKADTDEALLKDLTKRLAQSFSSLDPEQQRAAEQEIAVAQAEIQSRRREAQAALDGATREADAARRELKAARELYQQLRKDLDQLLPHLAADFSAEDRLAREADLFFPAGQIQALAREIDDGERHFGMLGQSEQFAQLKIWIGRFRRLQWLAETGRIELTEEELASLRAIFPRLVGISKTHTPGYIEAFTRTFETDWDSYIAEATEQLHQASAAVRRDRESEQRRREAQLRDAERQRHAREAGQAALEELKSIIAHHHLPDEGVEEFLAALARVISHLGTAEPALLELVRPHADLLDGREFRALRRNLERVDSAQARGEENESLREQYQDLLGMTRGRKVVMIGGDIREENRKSLIQVFEFDELEWIPYEGARPAMLRSLEQRVRNRGMDLVLILKDFVGHHVSESLRPLCEQHEIPCLMVDRGYGVAQIAECLRKSQQRTISEAG